MRESDRSGYKAMLRAIVQQTNGLGDPSRAYVSVQLAKQYNQILDVVARSIPEKKQFLPEAIPLNGPFSEMGVTNTPLFDLRVFANQVIEQL